MVVPTRAQSSKSTLVVEEINARLIQAQFTRFQMAIGLRKSLTDKGKFWSLVTSDICGFSTNCVVVQKLGSLPMEAA